MSQESEGGITKLHGGAVVEMHNATPNKPLHEVIIEQGFAKEEDVLAVVEE